MNPRAIIIGFVMFLLIGGSATYVVLAALEGENNFDLLSPILEPCTPHSVATSSRMVALRLDDVQAYAWRDVQRRIIEDTLSSGAPMVLAVIPKSIRDDQQTYRFLRAYRCNVEFAIHGWDHLEPSPGHGEFAFLSESEAAERLSQGKAAIDRLARESVLTFVPPNNEYSTSTAMALKKMQFKRVSGYHEELLDADTSMFDFKEDIFRSAEAVVEDCEAKYAAGDSLCVVMLHPQDFTTGSLFDEKKYAEYTKLLALFAAKNVSFVRLSDVVERVPIKIRAISTYQPEL